MAETNTNYRFSFILEQYAEHSIIFFKFIGRGIAWASSYLWYIRWNRIYTAFIRLFVPSFNLATSWLYIGKGYAQYAVDWAIDIPALYSGSAILIFIALLVTIHTFPGMLTSGINSFIELLPRPNVNHIDGQDGRILYPNGGSGSSFIGSGAGHRRVN